MVKAGAMVALLATLAAFAGAAPSSSAMKKPWL